MTNRQFSVVMSLWMLAMLGLCAYMVSLMSGFMDRSEARMRPAPSPNLQPYVDAAINDIVQPAIWKIDDCRAREISNEKDINLIWQELSKPKCSCSPASPCACPPPTPVLVPDQNPPTPTK